ncbi:acyltransferase family protein [Escherichia albertii]|uniref:acyltransferase family protein n=1 Tax=Escherichia albertii TaxID=208962 RepID=UPI000B2D232E|nr:acyltransferase family protein [Escherichia albertii]
MTLTKEQSDTLYIVKGIGIIAVVIGHSWGILVGITKPYFYHMPLFFFVGGFFIDGITPFKTIKKTLSKIIMYFIVTYLIIGMVSVGISKIYGIGFGLPFSEHPIETIISIFKNNFHNNELFLVGWFLFAYLLSNIISTIIISLSLKIKDTKTQKITIIAISICFGYVSTTIMADIYKITGEQIYNLTSQVLYATMFMLIGCCINSFILHFKNKIIALILFILVLSLYLSGLAKPMIMSWSAYPSGFVVTTIMALLCILLIFFVSSVFNGTYLSTFLKDAGKYSRGIMSYHLCIFVFLDMIFSLFGLWDMRNTKTLVHYHTFYTQLLYPFSAIAIPLLLARLLSKVKK